jgi:NAD(P)-dependent dehydrogenase (short-subunit alcohol dehydrogenase family)
MNSPPARRFEGRVLFATGAGSGIAEAVARRFVQEGGRVAVVDRDGDRAAAVAGELDGSVALGVDVSSENAVAAAVAETLAQLGRIDCVVNAAGHYRDGPLARWSLARWNQMLGVHAGGTFLVCKHALPPLRAQGSGSIVNVASIAAVVAQPENVAYGTAKGAIVSLSRQLALEAAPDVRVNAVLPGRVRTGMTQGILEKIGKGDVERGAALAAAPVPLGRMADPEDLAAPICFLLADEARFITGASLVIDGGETIV